MQRAAGRVAAVAAAVAFWRESDASAAAAFHSRAFGELSAAVGFPFSEIVSGAPKPRRYACACHPAPVCSSTGAVFPGILSGLKKKMKLFFVHVKSTVYKQNHFAIS